MSHDAQYWREVGEQWATSNRDGLWRKHCDDVNARLVTRWLPTTSVSTLLKTDLFDEALSAGMHEWMRDRAHLVVGMDLAQPIAQQAIARCPGLRVLRADARALPFVDGAFDVVVSLSTLDHFHRPEDLAASLRQLGRVVRQGGLLLLTLDNPANPIVALRNALPFRLLNRLGLVPYFVGATAGPARLAELLAAAGFSVVETTTTMHCPRWLAVPGSRLVGRLAGASGQAAWLGFLGAMEGLAALPTRWRTGHFLAVLARKL
jgi:SAM-dependent methyltransferase